MTEQSLDFIFKLSRNDIPSEHREDYKNLDIGKLVGIPSEITSDLDNQGLIGGKPSLRVISDSIWVEQFPIKDKEFATLSDHFGLSVELKF